MKFDRIAHQNRALEPGSIECRADRADASVHHVARGDTVPAGLGVGDSGLHQFGHAGIVVEVIALGIEYAAVAVRRR